MEKQKGPKSQINIIYSKNQKEKKKKKIVNGDLSQVRQDKAFPSGKARWL